MLAIVVAIVMAVVVALHNSDKHDSLIAAATASITSIIAKSHVLGVVKHRHAKYAYVLHLTEFLEITITILDYAIPRATLV